MCAESVNSPGSVGYGRLELVYNIRGVGNTGARNISRLIHKRSVDGFYSILIRVCYVWVYSVIVDARLFTPFGKRFVVHIWAKLREGIVKGRRVGCKSR